MKKNVAYQKDSMSVCFEKFVAYATPRDIQLDASSYGFYEVRRKDTKRVLGAVKAVKADGTEGWVINWADKQRKFVANSDTTVTVGKKVSPQECLKERRKKPVPAAADEETDD